MNKNIACIFPGQGSQSLGMLQDFSETSSELQSIFDRASSVLGYDLWDLCQNGPEEKLNQTQVTQPALLTAEYALWQMLNEKQALRPVVLAGHSLGEYSALLAAGVMRLEDAVSLVELRGEYMQAAVPAGVGAMCAVIGLSDEQVIECCAAAEAGAVVAPVNFNAPGQVVIAGEKEAVDRAQVLCNEAGARKLMPLAVSVPSHCALMQPAADALAAKLESMPFNKPSIPVINNVDVAVCEDEKAIKSALVKQLYSPVRWTECIEKLAEFDVDLCLECGPGKVLKGLNKRINKVLTTITIGSVTGFNQFTAAGEE